MQKRFRQSKDRAVARASVHGKLMQSRREPAACRHSEQLGNCFTHVAEAVFITGLNGRIIAANPAACEMLGFSQYELLTMCQWDFVTGASRAEIPGLLRNLQRGAPATVQRTCHRKSGEHLMIDLRLKRFKSVGRDLIIVSCRDVTQTRWLEEQLRASEETLAEGQRLTKTGSWVLDLKTGHLECSVEFCRIFGFPDPPPSPHHDELMARVHPRDREPMVAMVEDSSSWGETRLWQYRFTLPDGTIRHGESNSQPVRDENGVVVGRMGTVMDITVRHKAEEDLRASEKLARGQVQALTRTLDAMAKEAVPDKFLEHVLSTIIEQLNADSISIWHNDESGRLLNLQVSRESLQLQPKPGAAHTSLKFSPAMYHSPLWPEICRTGKPAILEDVRRMAASHSSQRYLLAQGIISILGVPLLIADEVAGMIGIRFNYKRTFLEEEIELARALAHQVMLALQLTRLSDHSRQAAVVAERNRMARDIHDTLAQGFTGVIVQLEAAEDAISKGLTHAADEHLERAGEMARYGLSEARRSVHALRPQALEENDVCAALDGIIKKMTRGTNLRAEFTVQGQPRPLPPEWDEHLLHIGQEALTNTLRHASANRFSIQLVFDSDEVSFELHDNGCGFDPDDKRDGFGLLGVKERVAEMGGDLTIDSAPGKGTSISIILPLADIGDSNGNEHTA